MNKKNLFSTISLSILLYYITPLIFLRFYSDTSDKAGFILMLFYIFASFATTLLTAFFFQKNILSPVLSTVISLPLLFVFNSSAIVLVVIVAVFSFVGYLVATVLK